MKFDINLTRRQRTGLLVLALALVIGLLALPRLLRDTPGETPERDPVLMDIQDPETDSLEQSKLSAYRRGEDTGARRMWDDLEAETDDPYAEAAERRQGSSSSGRAPAATEEDLYGSISSGSGSPASPSSSRGSGPRPGDADYRERRMRQYYENTDAATRRGEAEKDSILRSGAGQSNEAVTPSPAPLIGDSVAVRRSTAMSILDPGPGQGFSSLSDGDELPPDGTDYPFECMFVRSEKLRSGTRVSVRLLEDMVVGGVLIPKNTHLMAMCTISQRLELTVSSVEMNSRIYQLGYEAYDTDGAKGIYCPDLGGETRRSLQSRGLSSISRLIGGRMARLATDAVQAGVSVAQSRSGEVTVTVPAGYRFFIVRKQR